MFGAIDLKTSEAVDHTPAEIGKFLSWCKLNGNYYVEALYTGSKHVILLYISYMAYICKFHIPHIHI